MIEQTNHWTKLAYNIDIYLLPLKHKSPVYFCPANCNYSNFNIHCNENALWLKLLFVDKAYNCALSFIDIALHPQRPVYLC